MKPVSRAKIGFELLGAGFEFAGAFGGAIRLAIEVFLLDLEARQRSGL